LQASTAKNSIIFNSNGHVFNMAIFFTFYYGQKNHLHREGKRLHNKNAFLITQSILLYVSALLIQFSIFIIIRGIPAVEVVTGE
jgi:hypothetical protein